MEMTMTKRETGFITFGNWTEFSQKLQGLSEKDLESEQSLCESMEIDTELYQKMIRSAVYAWKNSPSTSIFHSIGKNGLSMPKEGETVFDSHIAQTRFLLMLCESRIISKLLLKTVRDENGEKVKVRNEYAVTLPEGERGEVMAKKVNEVLQIVYLYFWYCKKQEEKAGFKKPKKIYRGIRLRDFYRLPAIQKAIENVPPSTERGFDRKRRKAEYDCIVEYLMKNGIREICENDLVSFTSSKTIAKYFANKGGLIIEVNANDVEIMTSEVHDERFAEKDYVSNKLEKEYILRLTDTSMEISNIEIYDLDYYIAINSPLSVSMFDHSDKSATYELNGVHIKAYYVWTSNTTSAIHYKNLDTNSWGYGSREFQKEFGFSPVISNKNLKDIKNFQVHID
ncbi:hypothetical protein CVD28_03220 [Bacillus sp. M6-12]|uniref:hypothetical protein n=1 Tax=Bacillus sp. M6-12 TaxID=2054166 RepID=UPI000C7934EF|nr:hypothetical protein [Bacillus sp. M6-12]PLS19441.1 hypothetical protein CVD28_03220 [Bacillus sp. M6-12]